MTTTATTTTAATTCPDCTDGLGAAAPVPHGGLRHRLRTNRAVAPFYRIGVFALGLLFVALGIALAVLPGPLTIPPVLLGLWIWSTEFRWAARFFDAFRDKARDAWAHARRHPVSSSVVTVTGLAAAAGAMVAVKHYEVGERVSAALGL